MKPVSLVRYGDISANLDQAMSKKKKKKKEKKKKRKEKKKKENNENRCKNTHSSLGLTGQNFAFGTNF